MLEYVQVVALLLAQAGLVQVEQVLLVGVLAQVQVLAEQVQVLELVQVEAVEESASLPTSAELTDHVSYSGSVVLA